LLLLPLLLLLLLLQSPLIWLNFIAVAISLSGLRRYLDPDSPAALPALGFIDGLLTWFSSACIPVLLFANGVWMSDKQVFSRSGQLQVGWSARCTQNEGHFDMHSWLPLFTMHRWHKLNYCNTPVNLQDKGRYRMCCCHDCAAAACVHTVQHAVLPPTWMCGLLLFLPSPAGHAAAAAAEAAAAASADGGPDTAVWNEE
jgi:hypothetical protein